MKHITDKKESVFALFIIVLYAFFAFYHLGDHQSIQTFFQSPFSVTTEVAFQVQRPIKKIMVYTGWKDNQNITFSYQNLQGKFESHHHNFSSVFSWNEYACQINTATIVVELPMDSCIGEIAFLDENNVPLTVINTEHSFTSLFDENARVPAFSTYENSLYFDEIYHARTAYELTHNLPIYEWTHPPLGKLLIALGVMIFGVNPFGFRFMGTLFGILMLPIMYLFGKRMFSKKFGIIAMTFFALDFMHYTQTRIATIDSFLVFFLLVSFYFMYCYYTENRNNKAFIYFIASGLSFGLSVCVKWNAAFSGLPLLVIFLIAFIKKVKHISHKKPFLFQTLFVGVLAFAAIPFVFYLLCYLPVYAYTPRVCFQNLWQEQIRMYDYHAHLTAAHPYSSPWWQWPVMLKPIFYYTQDFSNGIRAGIDAFGNPIVWWGGLCSLFINLFFLLKKREKRAVFLCLGYVLSLIPWIFITRVAFIYHYFPMTIFCVLLLTNVLYYAHNRWLNRILLLMALVLFLLYFPVLSGRPIAVWYVDTFLRWIPIAF